MPPQAQPQTQEEIEENDPSTAPATEGDVEAPKPKLVQTVINGVPVEHLYEVLLPKKGRRTSDKLVLKIVPPLDVPSPFANFTRIVGVIGFIKAVYEDVVVAACQHATKQAETEEGLSLVKFGEALVDYFSTDKTRGASGIREAKKKFQALTHEVTPYIIKMMNPEERDSISEEDQKYWNNKIVEWKELEAKVFGSANKGQGKAAKKPAAPVAKAA